MRRVIWVGCLLPVLACCGCATVEVGVSNPVPGLSRVAVVPFFNMSSEPAADGRRFAEAYFTELQKTPGFEVLPIGVTEVTIRQHGLNMNSPEDALKLARILDVDAVALGAITAYDPYYPPRLGLRVAWYSPYNWHFSPGIPTDPHARPPALALPIPALPSIGGCFKGGNGGGGDTSAPRGQSGQRFWNRRGRDRAGSQNPLQPGGATGPGGAACRDENDTAGHIDDDFEAPIKRDIVCDPTAVRGQSPDPQFPDAQFSDGASVEPSRFLAPEFPPVHLGALPPFDPTRPLMSYARIFDGADADLTAALRDYVELSDDLRGGRWQAYLYRSDDFLRFTARLMIDEMLMLHGGETRHRLVLARRRQK